MFVFQETEQSSYSDGGLGQRSGRHSPVSDDGAFASTRGRRGRSVVFQMIAPFQAHEEEKRKRDISHILDGSAFASARRAVVFQTIAPLQAHEEEKRKRDVRHISDGSAFASARRRAVIFQTIAPLQALEDK